MANEVTSGTFDDATNSNIVAPLLLRSLNEQPGLYKTAREFNLTGQASNTIKIPTLASYWGSVGDRGAGVDTEFDATQAVSLSNTAVSTGNVSISAAEYGIAHTVTDNVQEDTISAIDVLQVLSGTMLSTLMLALDDDLVALFSGLSNSVGSTGTDLSIAQMLSAISGTRNRIGGTVPDRFIAVLDPEQVANIEAALIAGTGVAYAMAADRLIGYQPGGLGGANEWNNRSVMTIRGVEVVQSGLTDTANTGADVVGAVYTPSTAANDAAGLTTFGMVWKRLPRLETQRQAKLRANELVLTCRAGFGELMDGTGTAIITDAP